MRFTTLLLIASLFVFTLSVQVRDQGKLAKAKKAAEDDSRNIVEEAKEITADIFLKNKNRKSLDEKEFDAAIGGIYKDYGYDVPASADLDAAFKAADVNGDKKIDRTEIQSAVLNFLKMDVKSEEEDKTTTAFAAEIAKTLFKYDANKNGLDFNEYKKGSQEYYKTLGMPAPSDKELQDSFKTADVNGNKRITQAEAIEALEDFIRDQQADEKEVEALAKKVAAGVFGNKSVITEAEFNAGIAAYNKKNQYDPPHPSELKKVFVAADKNKDGKLTRKEGLAAVADYLRGLRSMLAEQDAMVAKTAPKAKKFF